MAPAIRDAARAVEAGIITEALGRHGFHRLATARALGIHKSTLHRKIRALGLALPDRDGRAGRRAPPPPRTGPGTARLEEHATRAVSRCPSGSSTV